MPNLPAVTIPRTFLPKDLRALAEQARERLNKVDADVTALASRVGASGITAREAADIRNQLTQMRSQLNALTAEIEQLEAGGTTTINRQTYALIESSSLPPEDAMLNTPISIGPVAIGATAADVLSPPALDGTTGVGVDNTETYILIKHLRVTNTTAAAIDVTLYKGATGAEDAGTEIGWAATEVPANESLDFYPAGGLRLKVGDFLVAKGSVTGLVLSGTGEIGVA